MDSINLMSNFQQNFNLERLRTEGGALRSRFNNFRSLKEFFDLKRISRPVNFAEVQSRWSYNLSYFATNYALVFSMLSIYSLLTNSLLLFVICFVVAGLYGISLLKGNDLELGLTRLTTSQLYSGLLIVAVPITIFASPLATILWLLGASGVTILGHAALLEKPVESAFTEEAV